MTTDDPHRLASSASDHPMPRIGDKAPAFQVRTTMGDRSLGGYRGRWLLLFSHPSDFTPVCTSEFLAFAQQFEAFQKLGCDLLGLSVDSLYSHLAWVRSIRVDFGVEIPFPLAEDLSMSMAAAYGMIHPADANSSTVRATFFIDPTATVRMITYYPMSTGRNVEELVRALAALQETEATGLSTPAGWQPGDDGIRSPPTTVAEADASERAGAPAWYYQPQKGRKAKMPR